jgi:hypothetical protein
LGLWKTAATPTLLACLLIVRCCCSGQDGNLEFAALCVSKITAELLETVEGWEENPSFHYQTRALQIVDSSEGIASCTYNILDQGAPAVLVSTALNTSLRWSFVWQIFVGIESFGNTEMELKFSSLQ